MRSYRWCGPNISPTSAYVPPDTTVRLSKQFLLSTAPLFMLWRKELCHFRPGQHSWRATRIPPPRGHFPVPVSETVCGLVLALSFTYIVAVRVPVAPGVKVTEIVHLPFDGTLAPHVFVGEVKSPGSVP